MTHFDNKINLSKIHNAYTPNLRKEDTEKSQQKSDNISPEIVDNGTQAAESYGRILVKKGKVENPEMVQCIKDSIDFFIDNPDLVAAGVKAADDAYELLQADGCPDAYEKSCSGACDAVLAR